MPADCQACLKGVPTRANPKEGNRNDPMGTCYNCHSLACPYHGHRDGTVPEFICVECDPSLLSASAASTMRTMTTRVPPILLIAASTYHLFQAPPERWRVDSLEQFVQRRPYSYGEDFLEGARDAGHSFVQEWRARRLRDILDIPTETRDLLVAAGYIMRVLELPREDVHPSFREIFPFLWR